MGVSNLADRVEEVLSGFVFLFWCAFDYLFTPKPGQDFPQAGRLFALLVHGS